MPLNFTPTNATSINALNGEDPHAIEEPLEQEE